MKSRWYALSLFPFVLEPQLCVLHFALSLVNVPYCGLLKIINFLIYSLFAHWAMWLYDVLFKGTR